MSTVRLCDRCNTIFSENKEGWTTASGSRRVRNSRGEMITETIALDYCPACSEDVMGNNQEEVSVPAVKGRYDKRYTRQLEREAGIGETPTNLRDRDHAPMGYDGVSAVHGIFDQIIQTDEKEAPKWLKRVHKVSGPLITRKSLTRFALGLRCRIS